MIAESACEEPRLSLVSIIVPVYNEQETIDELHSRVSSELAGSSNDIEFVFVNDGSRDRSSEMLRAIARRDPRVRGIEFARNFGHEAAIEAGIREARGDALLVMDADLQDSPAAVSQLIAAWENGADVAYAVRQKRKEGVLLRAAFSVFYRLAGRVMSIDLPQDAGPFSLMSRRAADALNAMPEFNRYFPGLRAFTGFNQVAVPVERHERLAGETKYSIARRAAGGINAIVSFSKLPLRAATVLGLASAAISLFAGVFVLVAQLVGAALVPGWASIMIVVLLFSGVQLLTLGIVGEYVGKIFDEVRRRPTYIIAERFGQGS
ncbi:MAG: glycosyltransferase family 2 protein [Actinobacteria bacterium]|nr:glycosyltransferase family 2 protein [Actinomycetota bacterium]